MKREEISCDSPFKYFVKFEKSFTEGDDMFVQGVASGTEIDRQESRMSLQALQSFVDGLPLPLTDNHEHGNVGAELGQVVDAHIQDDGSLFIKAKLDKDNPFSAYLINKVNAGKKYAFSIEGRLKKAVNTFDRKMGAFIKEYVDIIPEAISVTTCPVYEPSFLEVVEKSFANSQSNIINKLSNKDESMNKVEKSEEMDKELEKALKSFSMDEVKKIGDNLKVDWDTISLEEFFMGVNHELEHGTKNPETNVTNDDPIETGKIALEHLKEDPEYYSKLAEVEPEVEKANGDEMEEKMEEAEEKREVIEESKELVEEVMEAQEAAEEVEEAVEEVTEAAADLQEAVECVAKEDVDEDMEKEPEEAHEEEAEEEVAQETTPIEESKSIEAPEGEETEEESEETQEDDKYSELEAKVDALTELVKKLLPEEEKAAEVSNDPLMKALELLKGIADQNQAQDKVVKSLSEKVNQLESLPLMKKTLARPSILKSEDSADVAPKTVKDIVKGII